MSEMSTSNHGDSPQMTELYDIEKGTLDKVSLEDVYNSEEHFVNWTKSESFKTAHKNAGDHKDIYLGHPMFEGFHVVL